jgi:hypothetical protein
MGNPERKRNHNLHLAVLKKKTTQQIKLCGFQYWAAAIEFLLSDDEGIVLIPFVLCFEVKTSFRIIQSIRDIEFGESELGPRSLIFIDQSSNFSGETLSLFPSINLVKPSSVVKISAVLNGVRRINHGFLLCMTIQTHYTHINTFVKSIARLKI